MAAKKKEVTKATVVGDIPHSGDTLDMCKAYLMKDDEEMKFDLERELMFTEEEKALAHFLNNDTERGNVSPQGKVISFLHFEIPLKENESVKLYHFNPDTGSYGICMNQIKNFNMSVVDKLIEQIEYDVDKKTEIKTITKLDMKKI